MGNSFKEIYKVSTDYQTLIFEFNTSLYRVEIILKLTVF